MSRPRSHQYLSPAGDPMPGPELEPAELKGYFSGLNYQNLLRSGRQIRGGESVVELI
jgi:hypothetical protein